MDNNIIKKVMKTIEPSMSPMKNLAITSTPISTLLIKERVKLVNIELNKADIIITKIRCMCQSLNSAGVSIIDFVHL